MIYFTEFGIMALVTSVGSHWISDMAPLIYKICHLNYEISDRLAATSHPNAFSVTIVTCLTHFVLYPNGKFILVDVD